MNIHSPSDLNKIIRSRQGDTSAIKVAVMETIATLPASLFSIPQLERYLTFDERRDVVRRIMANSKDI